MEKVFDIFSMILLFAAIIYAGAVIEDMEKKINGKDRHDER